MPKFLRACGGRIKFAFNRKRGTHGSVPCDKLADAPAILGDRRMQTVQCPKWDGYAHTGCRAADIEVADRVAHVLGNGSKRGTVTMVNKLTADYFREKAAEARKTAMLTIRPPPSARSISSGSGHRLSEVHR